MLCYSQVFLFGGEGSPRVPVDDDSTLYVLDCQVFSLSPASSSSALCFSMHTRRPVATSAGHVRLPVALHPALDSLTVTLHSLFMDVATEHVVQIIAKTS